MIIRPPKFSANLRAAIPVPADGNLAIEEALRKLAEMIDRDPSVQAIANARRNRLGSQTRPF